MPTKEQKLGYSRNWYSRNKERERLRARIRTLKVTFGITLEQYDVLLKRQNGCCAVCERPSSQFTKNLAIDHDHHSGEIRGLLCTNCNRRIIGRYRRELGLDLLRKAVLYLENPYTGWFVPEKKKKKRKPTVKKTKAHARIR